MPKPLEYRLPCGCVSRWNDLEEQYLVAEHTCDGTVLKAQRKEQQAAIVRRHEESAKRMRGHLNGDRAFRLMR
jgi:hypothetical protein